MLYTISQILRHACHDCVTFKPQTLFKHPLMPVKRVGVKIWEQLLIPHALSALQMQLHGSYSTNNGLGSLEPSCQLIFPFDKTVLQSALSRKPPGSHHCSDNPDLTLGARTLQFCYSALISPLSFRFLYCCQPPNALSSMLQKGSSVNISACWNILCDLHHAAANAGKSFKSQWHIYIQVRFKTPSSGLDQLSQALSHSWLNIFFGNFFIHPNQKPVFEIT